MVLSLQVIEAEHLSVADKASAIRSNHSSCGNEKAQPAAAPLLKFGLYIQYSSFRKFTCIFNGREMSGLGENGLDSIACLGEAFSGLIFEGSPYHRQTPETFRPRGGVGPMS